MSLVDSVAQALADPIRRQILLMLRRCALSAGSIASAFDVSRPAVSRHLRVLRQSGLVQGSPSGRERVYRLEVSALDPLEAFLRELRAPGVDWERRFDALETEVHRVRNRRRKANAARPPARQRRKESA